MASYPAIVDEKGTVSFLYIYIYKHLLRFATCKRFSEIDEEEENEDEDSSLLDRKNGSWRSS